MAISSAMAVFAAQLVQSGNILSDAGMVILIGLSVVFVALIALTIIFWLFGRTMHRGNTAQTPVAPAVQAEPVVFANRPLTNTNPSNGISEEVIAVIAAAVAAMAPEGTRYVVRQVSHSRGERSAWAAAGLLENTRPF